MKIAKIGDVVRWPHTVKGVAEVILTATVVNVYEGTAIVDLSKARNRESFKIEERTNVRHSRYEIVENEKDINFDVEVSFWIGEPIHIKYSDVTKKEYSDVKTYRASEKTSSVKTVNGIEIVPGSKDNYFALKNSGVKDIDIRKLWDENDKEVKWHNNRFYNWKDLHGVKGERLSKGKAVDINKTPAAPIISVRDERNAKNHTSQFVNDSTNETTELATPKTEKPQTSTNPDLALENARLLEELASLRKQLWLDRTAKLFSMQAKLDALICESNNLNLSTINQEHILATIVELAEGAQEEKQNG